MSLRIVWVHAATALLFLCNSAVACVVPIAPAAPPGPTEVDQAYYYSTIGQEMIYAALIQNARAAASEGFIRPASFQAAGQISRDPLVFALRLGAVDPRCTGGALIPGPAPSPALCPTSVLPPKPTEPASR